MPVIIDSAANHAYPFAQAKEETMLKVIMATDTYWPRINGVTVSIDTFRRELIKSGVSIMIFSPEYPSKEGVKYSNHPHIVSFKSGDVFRFASIGLFFDREDQLILPAERFRMFAKFDEIKPDIVHIQTEFMAGIISKSYCRRRKVPMVMTCHTYFEQYIKFYLPFLPQKWTLDYSRMRTAKIYNEADIVICPTLSMKGVLEDYGVKKPIEVIPTGIPKEDFAGVSKDRERNSSWVFKKYPQLRGRKILLFVGRIAKEKNIDFLVETVRNLKPDFPKIALLLAGDGPYREELSVKLAGEGLEDSIIILGYVERKMLKSLYGAADIFTFASKTETQGLVATEAMICRTPVVAVGIMGTKEVMNGDNGGFMTGDDVGEFTAKVSLLLTDKKIYEAKSREAFIYSQQWTSDKMAKKLLAVYRSLV